MRQQQGLLPPACANVSCWCCVCGAALLLLVGASGCSIKAPQDVYFSPDGRTIAFFWDEKVVEPWVDGSVLVRATHVCWCPTEQPDSLQSVRVGSAIGRLAGYSAKAWSMKFSPDSAYLAVVAPSFYEFRVIDLPSGRHWRLTQAGEFVTSFSWLGGDEIGYVTHRKDRGVKTKRSFWRQKLGMQPGERVCVYAEGPLDANARPGSFDRHSLERWSPTGQHVLFMSPAYRGQLKLLDVESGVVRGIGRGGVHLEGVSWHGRGSAAFSVTDVTGDIGHPQALLIDPGTGEVRDRTKALRSAFTRSAPVLEALWTADGKYILAHDLETGACLIQPEPWKVIQLGQRLEKRSLVNTSAGPPRLFRLPIPGWVGITAHRWGGYVRKYAADYAGQKAIVLMDVPDYWGAFSPDATFGARVDRKKKVTVLRLGKWWQK